MKAFLSRHWFLVSLLFGVSLALGWPVAFGQATHFLEPRLVIAVALLLIAWTMPGRSLADELARPWAALWAVGISFGFLPAVGWLLGGLAPTADLRVGLLLAASVPCTLASAVLWTRLAGGNEATALLTIVVSTLSSWIFTTTWLMAVSETSLEISPFDLMTDLVLTLVAPVAVGQAARLWRPLAQVAASGRGVLGTISQILILAIVLKAASTVGLEVRHGSASFTGWMLVVSASLAVALHLLALTAGFWSSRWLGFDRPRQIAVAISCSQKTLPVSLFLFLRYFKEAYPLAVVPLLAYHVGQLVFDTVIAQWLARAESRPRQESQSLAGG